MLHHLNYSPHHLFQMLDPLPLIARIQPALLNARERLLEGGFVHFHCEEQALTVRRNVPLASGHFLARIVAFRPPFSVVLTDWLSTIMAEGCLFFPL